ncbi:tumor necrosis factor ligand superfamily member 14 isoform X2 [Hyperolius riggenbachi]|uniref:tumor necrosis factor ligand superfamily member 14 isoform X2 n=1 Tax=Hyperolius riggenbachi TaxID=752182 RepID=UPI0035A32301
MDRYVSAPMSVFTVVEPGQSTTGGPSLPPPAKKRVLTGSLLLQLILLLFAVLALCGATSQVYYLWKVQSSLVATQDMINMRFDAQKMTFTSDTAPLPSAHVTGVQVTENSPSTHLEWEPTTGQAFLRDVIYRDGALLCTKSGLYFVYSKLRLGIAPCNMSQSLFYTHVVHKRTSNKARKPISSDCA